MAYSAPANIVTTQSARGTDAGAVHAYHILHTAFVLVPLIAGIDKFFNLLTDWEKYLAPGVASAAHVSSTTFMMGVGAIEIVAAVIVAIWPRVGAYIVALWLAGIVGNLVLNPTHYWDVAARDFGLFLGALSLGSLSTWFQHDRPAP